MIKTENNMNTLFAHRSKGTQCTLVVLLYVWDSEVSRLKLNSESYV